jgi:carboxylesterase
VNIPAIGVLGALGVIVTLISRAVIDRRAAQFASLESQRSKGPEGVFAGAESVVLESSSSDRAALLLHGFNDTPQSLAYLGSALHERGWTVLIPLLPHHGRGAELFLAEGKSDAWLSEARKQWTALRKRSNTVVLVGQSMGGAIAAVLASEQAPSALVLLAPYFSMGRGTRTLARIWPVWQLFAPRLRSDPERALRDPAARTRSLGGTRFSPRLVAELLRIVQAARRSLELITVPTLVIHALADYRIPSLSAREAYERIGSRDKTLIWNTRGGHVVAADEGRDDVVNHVVSWLESHVARDAPAAGNTSDIMGKR